MIDSSSLCHTVRLQPYYVPGLLCAEERPELLMALYLFTVCTYLHICTYFQLCTVTSFVISAVESNRLQHMNIIILLFRACCQKTSSESHYVQTIFSLCFITLTAIKTSDPCHTVNSMYRTSALNSIFSMRAQDSFYTIH